MSSRHEASRPIKRVKIKLKLDGDRAFIEDVSKRAAGSKLSDGSISLTITADDPQGALEQVRSLAASIKNASSASKDFK